MCLDRCASVIKQYELLNLENKNPFYITGVCCIILKIDDWHLAHKTQELPNRQRELESKMEREIFNPSLKGLFLGY